MDTGWNPVTRQIPPHKINTTDALPRPAHHPLRLRHPGRTRRAHGASAPAPATVADRHLGADHHRPGPGPPARRAGSFRQPRHLAVHGPAARRFRGHLRLGRRGRLSAASALPATPRPGKPSSRRAHRTEGWQAVEFQFGTAMAPIDAASKAYVGESFTTGRPVLEALLDLNERFYTEFRFRSGVTTISTPVSQVMARREGVCQDFSHAMISGLRGIGMPARYTSGYIRTKPPPGQVKRQGADQSHAWVGCWLGPEHRLGGRRPDQRHRGEGRARPAGLGPRFQRRQPGPRRDPGRRRPRRLGQRRS